MLSIHNFKDSQNTINESIEIYQKGDEIWFKGVDAARTLGYKNTVNAIQRHVEPEDKLTKELLFKEFELDFKPPETGGLKNSNVTQYINESGLYSLIMSSHLPHAKEFKRWVTGFVLPSIRKTGKYDVKNDLNVIPKLTQDVNDFINKSCVYIISLGNNEYKFGITADVTTRLAAHKNELQFKHIVKLYDLPNTDESKRVEDKVKFQLKHMGILIKKGTKTEIFKTNTMYTIDEIIALFDKYVNEVLENEENLIDILEIEKYKLDKQTELEKYRLDIELEKYKFDLQFNKNNISQIIEQIDIIDTNPIINKINDSIINNLEHELNVDTSNDEVDIVKDVETEPKTKSKSTSTKGKNICKKCGYFTSTIDSCKTCDKFDRYAKASVYDPTQGRPTDEQLLNDLKTMPYSWLAKKYGVSPTAVKKWVKKIKKQDSVTNVIKIDDELVAQDIDKHVDEIVEEVEEVKEIKQIDNIIVNKINKNNTNKPKCVNCGYFCSISSECKRCAKAYAFKQNFQCISERPTYEQLKEDVKNMPFVWIGKKYNVSDNCVRKWLKKHEASIKSEHVDQ
jgi:prophage antirepressor-like protein/predicted transcriptional regulator